MGESFLEKKGGSSSSKLVLNDVIEDFKYVYKGQTIKAGDFVNYINGVASEVNYGTNVDTQFGSSKKGAMVSAILLDDTRVFLAHSSPPTEDSTNDLYGVVFTINGSTITMGTDTLLLSGGYSGARKTALVLLKNGNLFLSYCNNPGSKYKLDAMIVTVEGTTVTPGTTTTVADNDYSGRNDCTATLLDDGNIFLAHAYGSSYYLYGSVCKANGTTITKGTWTSILSATNCAISSISSALTNDGNVFISHPYGSSYTLYGSLCKTAGTTISVMSNTALSTIAYSGYKTALKRLPDGRMFLAHSYSDSYALYSMIVTISGSSVSGGTDCLLNSTSLTGYVMSLELLRNNKVFIAHSHTSNTYYLYATVCQIDKAVTSALSTTALNTTSSNSGSAISTALMPNHIIFLAHSYGITNYELYAQLLYVNETTSVPSNNLVVTEYEQQVTPAIDSPFDAIALSSGKGSDYVEGEIRIDGNLFPIGNWTKESDTRCTKDGYTLTSSSITSGSSTTYVLSRVCDGVYSGDSSTNMNFWSGRGTKQWIKMQLPSPTKVRKMKIYFMFSTGTFVSAKMYGSKDDTQWTELYSFNDVNIYFDKEFVLRNQDYYTYYKFETENSDSNSALKVWEWQTSQHIQPGLVPAPSHNEQVKIAKAFIIHTDNLFAKTWTRVSDIEFVAEDGTKLTASNPPNMDAAAPYILSYACDGDTNTRYACISGVQFPYIEIELPREVMITKMIANVSMGSAEYLEEICIQGSKNNNEWVNLFTSKSTFSNEVTLTNTDYYKYYKISAKHTGIPQNANTLTVFEWQTAEYVEVI